MPPARRSRIPSVRRRATGAARTPRFSTGRWVDGLAHWTEGDIAYLSVAFTWRLHDAYMLAVYYRSLGHRVIAGGPALFQPKLRHMLLDVAEVPTKQITVDGKTRIVGADHPSGEAVVQHNAMATIASRGCPVGCSFCIVPAMEGKTFTLLPDFPVRPVLCDNNLSALPPAYQDHIISRYRAAGVPLLDANSGFEPRTFTDEVYARWKTINKGPWRFAYDDQHETKDVERVMRMLKDVSPRLTRVYTLIGNEPFDSCMERIRRVIDWGGEPYAQPMMKLATLEKRPHVRFDWTEYRLDQVKRWVNYHVWKSASFDRYDPSRKSASRPPKEQQHLPFETADTT